MLIFVPIQTELLSRYVKFFKSLQLSHSPEIQCLAKVVQCDVRSTTQKNISLIKEMSGLDPLSTSPYLVKTAIKVSVIPESDLWRPALLNMLLTRRKEMEVSLMKTEAIQSMIDSLCSS